MEPPSCASVRYRVGIESSRRHLGREAGLRDDELSRSPIMTLLSRDPRRQAEEALRAGDRHRALKAFARAGDWRRAATLAAELGDEEEMVRCSLLAAFGRLPEGGSGSLSTLQAAELLALRGHHEAAIPLFERAGAFLKAGESALAVQQPLRAAGCFRRAGAWSQASRSYEEAGKPQEAVTVLEEGVRELEGKAGGREAAGGRLEELRLQQADLLVRLGRKSTAATLLRSMPPSPRVADLFERAGRLGEAVQCHLDGGRIEDALRVAAKSPSRERLKAQIYLRAGRPVEAGDLFARLGAAREAAEAYEAAQEWSRAAYRWEAAREPRRAAEAYEKAGRLRDAARCFKAAEMFQQAAAAYVRAGEIGEAAALHTRQGQAVQAARTYLAAGDQVRAAAILMQMEPAAPGYGEGAILLAPLLIEAGFHEEALERLRRITPDGIPAGATPLLEAERDYWEGRGREAAGQYDTAQACYERVTALAPDLRDAQPRLERLRATSLLVADANGPPEPPEPRASDAGEVLAVGSRLAGRYEILAELGRGGMGRIYKARDLELGECVAVKTLVAPAESDPALETRLLREAQICRRISHPNVVRVYDLGRYPGGLFVTMEYLDGRDLAEVIAHEAPLPFARIRFILSGIAAGLHEAHSQGVVHRDLKPTNVIVAANRVKILDFGIASMKGLGARLTQTGVVVGTPMYMSPEQILRREVDSRSDLYSLGVLAHTLIAGREPFDLASSDVLLLRHLQEDPADVRTLRPETPESWAALLARLLAKSPEDRFQSAQELLDALAKLPV
jgi:tetratricopeptide (TPR) repeat protein